MLDILERSRPLLHMRECAALLLKLLQHCCMIKANRTSMFGLAAAQALLRRLPEALAEETLAPVAERIAAVGVLVGVLITLRAFTMHARHAHRKSSTTGAE